ncbi:hypothetical protein FRACYDRAFT_252540 [Fragilariopsis cylindrus CCMP1102]|uniref:Uncharacterized protein n=1 Tax=Fragilariopsis cylindrus CCMP1102 TaxID=635003 RepID=A0A1E7ELZ5_9STRA|nr:hypothetical protein FRACYDRAFT_252540 [Fragilariopsis cylindrus CCMP1102]|eukprot:OEU06911.1 hypothetical protein FRACYDRAFT_252540 [Fragilariopsis cylindrus CCMP1102]
MKAQRRLSHHLQSVCHLSLDASHSGAPKGIQFKNQNDDSNDDTPQSYGRSFQSVPCLRRSGSSNISTTYYATETDNDDDEPTILSDTILIELTSAGGLIVYRPIITQLKAIFMNFKWNGLPWEEIRSLKSKAGARDENSFVDDDKSHKTALKALYIQMIGSRKNEFDDDEEGGLLREVLITDINNSGDNQSINEKNPMISTTTTQPHYNNNNSNSNSNNNNNINTNKRMVSSSSYTPIPTLNTNTHTPWDRLVKKVGGGGTSSSTGSNNNHNNNDSQYLFWLEDADIDADEYNNTSAIDRRTLRSQFEKEHYNNSSNDTARLLSFANKLDVVNNSSSSSSSSDTRTISRGDDDEDEDNWEEEIEKANKQVVVSDKEKRRVTVVWSLGISITFFVMIVTADLLQQESLARILILLWSPIYLCSIYLSIRYYEEK